MKLWHELEIHPVQTGQEGDRQEDRADHGEDLHDFVESGRANGEVRLHDRDGEITAALDLIRNTNKMIIDVSIVHGLV